MTTLDHRTPTVLQNVPFVETTRPASPPPMPKPNVIDGEATAIANPHRIHVAGALTCLGVSVAGLVATALTEPALVAVPIGTTFAAAAAAGVVALVHDRWADKHTLKPV